MTALAAREDKVRLAQLEEVIERGLSTFIEVGQALLEVRESRLYRLTHGTFDDYCRERWGLSRSRAYRLMQAAEVGEAVSPIGDIPGNEAQARELVPLLGEPDQLRGAWAEVRERDLRLEVRAMEFFAVPMPLGFLLADFFHDNEDVLYPPSDGYQGGERYLTAVRGAVRLGWEAAAEHLGDERERADLQRNGSGDAVGARA